MTAAGETSSHATRRRRRQGLTLLLVGASLVLSALLTLDLFDMGAVGFAGRLPHVGEIADHSYKAPSDLTIVDEPATRELTRAAIDQAPAVYDFDERRSVAVAERLRTAFAQSRELLASVDPGDPDAPRAGAVFREALEVDGKLPDDGVALLEARGFDPADEAALITLVTPVLARMIVGDESDFRRRLERKTLMVREVGSGVERRPTADVAVLSEEGARSLLGDNAARVLAEREPQDRRALTDLAQIWVRPTAELNLRATEERKQELEATVKPVTIALRKGEIIVRDGSPITERHVRIIEGMRREARTTSQIEIFVGAAGLIFVLATVLWRFGTRAMERFPGHVRDALLLVSILVATVLGTRIGVFLCDAIGERPEVEPLLTQGSTLLYFVIPIAAATMLVRLVQSGEVAALFASIAALVAGIQLGGDLRFAVFVLVGSLVGALGSARVTQRGTLLRAGLRVGGANALVVVLLALLEGQTELVPWVMAAALGFVGGTLSGVLVSGLAPLVEGVFGYTTDVKLLEMANREQPLLRELELRAPGTYHHSMMVGHLAEKAAEAIGANALLAKVAGYYHDIGKMRRPHFFVENISIHGGENRHEKLSPSMSARIIQAHVKDGLEYGRTHKLAEPIMSGIAQHHGTSIIRFFFEKAKELIDPEKGTPVEEHDYRYPGPRPQTREAGILMLADSVEAASRTLADTSPARVQQLVQRIINNYFRDGQLDECSLTLRDLNAIARSFIDTLTAIRHERIDYPEATDSAGRKLDEDLDEGVVERLEPRTKDRPERVARDREDDLRRLGLP